MDKCWNDTERLIPNMDNWWNDTDKDRVWNIGGKIATR